MNTIDTPDVCYAAMHAALMAGNPAVKLSRSGFDVVFSADQCGRRDLSGRASCALRQLSDAGLDVDSVTPEQTADWRQWREGLDNAKRINDARIIITRTYAAEHGHDLVPTNGVALVDGFGKHIAQREVAQVEYYAPDATDRLGQPGAWRSRPDCERINAAIAALRAQYPAYAGAPVRDNNLG